MMRYRKTAAASAALAGALALGGVVACGDDPASPQNQEQQEQQEEARAKTLRVGDSAEFRFVSAVTDEVADFKITVLRVEYVERLSEYSAPSDRGTFVVVHVKLANVGSTNGHYHDGFHWRGPDGQVLETGVFHPEEESVSRDYRVGEYVRGAIVFEVPVTGGIIVMPGQPDASQAGSDTTLTIDLPKR